MRNIPLEAPVTRATLPASALRDMVWNDLVGGVMTLTASSCSWVASPSVERLNAAKGLHMKEEIQGRVDE